ncbi:Uncharacterized protein YhfW [Brachyspira suanatina]|uniref:Uncharacterized protein YhfW n=1 Tax=Brachyspira suanatina TaxID=381802 RepID=A0A0G4K7R9_9SPIR|nr:phosphopentomutase [Brachyspira suanatina]CRF33375.1 Uncharacterized protein YhfW [Brachyspira suanatina]
MKRFIVIVLDSFGIGEMEDVKDVRPQDIGSNTYRNVLTGNNVNIPNLAKLGIANAANLEIDNTKFSEEAMYGICKLKHDGCDTFYGHQELMGTDPKKPKKEAFYENIDIIENELIKNGYTVERYGNERKILIVNNCLSIGDNLEADLGQVYNITGTFDKISFDKLLEIGKIVRKLVKVPRVITFGGEDVSIEDIKNAYECKDGVFAGVSAPKSGVYNKGYKVQHMGYGINSDVQLPTILGNDVNTVLIGKVADIVENRFGKSIFAVDSRLVMDKLIEEVENNKTGFFCANIQETDLAGHQENAKKYASVLEIVDERLSVLMSLLDDDDILIITADHGNDPKIGHSHHTREMVPILVYKNIKKAKYIGKRETLADIGQTAAEYFNKKLPDNGTSFLSSIIED